MKSLFATSYVCMYYVLTAHCTLTAHSIPNHFANKIKIERTNERVERIIIHQPTDRPTKKTTKKTAIIIFMCLRVHICIFRRQRNAFLFYLLFLLRLNVLFVVVHLSVCYKCGCSVAAAAPILLYSSLSRSYPHTHTYTHSDTFERISSVYKGMARSRMQCVYVCVPRKIYNLNVARRTRLECTYIRIS